MQTSTRQKILVLGAGNFGTCLALHLSRLGHDVCIWAREYLVVDMINREHRNPKYLSQIELPTNLRACSALTFETVQGFDAIIIAIPTQFIRSVLQKIKTLDLSKLLICAAKGIEVGTEKLPLQIVSDVLGECIANQTVALSGPSFASEIAVNQPTGVSMASYSLNHALWGQKIFHSPYFRVYTSNDPIGLEVAGALKNVIAIASGACAGLGFQSNAKATLITRGLAEMTRIGVSLGANPLTFNGLGGVGDLFLTCTSEKSRNFTVGYRMAQGQTLAQVLASMGSVAEGVATTKSAYVLTNKLNVANPITSAVYQVLYENKPIKDAVAELMTRDAKPELT